MPKLAQPGGAIVVSGDIVVSAVSQALLFLEHDLHCQPMYTSSGSGSCTAKDALFRLRSQVVGHYLEAIRIDPYFSDAYCNLGNAYRCALCCPRPVLHARGGGYLTIPYHAIPYHAISYHTIPYHTMPCHAIPYHAMPCHAMPYHTIPCHTTGTWATSRGRCGCTWRRLS